MLVAPGLDPAPIVDDIIDLARDQKVRVKHPGRSEFEAASRTVAPQGVIAYAEPLPAVDLLDLLDSTGRAEGEGPADNTGPLGRADNAGLADFGGHGGRAGFGGALDGGVQSTARAGCRTASRPFVLVLDGITDPGNLGAVLRTAECAGVTGIVMRRHRAARITATAAKAASGAIEHLRFAMVPGLPAALRVLSRRRVWTVGLDPAGKQPLHGLDLAGEAIALVLGAEGRGLSRLVAQRCDVLASIPMHGVLGSLNVSAAAAVACFDIARGRA